MPALALSAKPRAIAGSIGPDASKRRTFLPDSSSPTLPIDITSPDTATAKRSLLPGYLNGNSSSSSPRKSRSKDYSSEESLPTPPPTSSVRDAMEDDGIEELSESDFTAEELSRSARRGRISDAPSSSSTRSPTRPRSPKRRLLIKSRSPERPERQVTLSQMFRDQDQVTPRATRAPSRATSASRASPATRSTPTVKATPAAKRRRAVQDSDDDDDNMPLVRSRARKSVARVESDDEDDVPLSVTRKGKGKERAIVPASDDEPRTSSSVPEGVVDLCSSDPIEADEPEPWADTAYIEPEPTAGLLASTLPPPEAPLDDADAFGMDFDYDDVPFDFPFIPDDPLPLSPPPARRPRASVFDLPDFAQEPASQVARSSSPDPSAARGGGSLPAVKFGDFALLSELDEPVRAFYEQHWRRGAGDNDAEWREEDQLAFTAKAPKRKAPAKRGGWWARGRGRGRGRGRR